MENVPQPPDVEPGTPIRSQQGASEVLPPGERIDIGGRCLEALSLGDGSPAAVIESGFGLELRLWRRVLPRVAAVTRVLVYNRAGLGGSDPPPGVRGIAGLVGDLEALLAAAAVPPPYVLVGHSLGSHIVRLFAARHPDQVSGLLLLDPQHERRRDFDPDLPTTLTDPTQQPGLRLPGHAERLAPDQDRRELEDLRLPTGVPVRIISRGVPDPTENLVPGMSLEASEAIWRRMQLDLAARLQVRAHIIASRSRHLIPRDEPGLVARELLTLVTAARAARAGERE